MSFLTTGGPIRDAKAWLIGAVCNASRHYWRTHHRRMQMEEKVSEAFLVTDDVSVERLERVIQLRAMLQHLSPRKCEVLRLHYYEGFTVQEIARMQGTSPGYAQRLVSKALRDLRSMHNLRSPRRKE